ncbi:MAG: RNA polymerase sigma factor [Bacteroidales bacterium]
MIDQIHPEIINRCKIKDMEAFGQLVNFYQEFVFNLAFRITGNDEDARDIVQESFIRVWKHISSFKMEVKFTTWLYRIVSNLGIDYLRSRQRKLNVSMDEFSNLYKNVMNQQHPENEMINSDLGKIIGQLTEKLSPVQRMIFTLRYIQEVETDEIAQITGLSADNIKSNLYHARKIIREKLIKLNLL